uniref:(California timema) hypothetical protein n=1 Tax=Timema californicum TaxID=61474 RepID=A0A7R9PB55_TIMCA|nr:unnamed protein product [Timema californicum]
MGSSSMASLVLTDSWPLIALKSYQTKLTYPYAEPDDLQNHEPEITTAEHSLKNAGAGNAN